MSNSATPRTVAHQTPLFMRFPRQEHWGGLPLPSPGDLPDPGFEPASHVFCTDWRILHHYQYGEAPVLTHGNGRMSSPCTRKHSTRLLVTLTASAVRVSLKAQLVKNRLQSRRPRLKSWVRKIRWRRDRLPTAVFLGFPGGSTGKESACSAGDLGLIPGLGRSPGEGKGSHSSILAWTIPWTTVHGMEKSQTRLSDFHFHFTFGVVAMDTTEKLL